MSKRKFFNFRAGPCDTCEEVRRELISLGADLSAKGVCSIIGQSHGEQAYGGAIAPKRKKVNK